MKTYKLVLIMVSLILCYGDISAQTSRRYSNNGAKVSKTEKNKPNNRAKIDKSVLETTTVTEIMIVDAETGEKSPEWSAEDMDTTDTIWTAVEESAEFPGGVSALSKWISENINYPQDAYNNDIEGRTVIKFVIWKDGSIRDPVVLKSALNRDLDAEALRIVQSMPKWIPAKNLGVYVNSYFNLPIVFKLNHD